MWSRSPVTKDPRDGRVEFGLSFRGLCTYISQQMGTLLRLGSRGEGRAKVGLAACLAIYIGLSIPVVVVVGCNAPAVITAERILSAAANAITALQFLQQLTSKSSSSVSFALRDARPEIAKSRIPPATLTGMEGRLQEMRGGYKVLDNQLSVARKAITAYLDMLETRTKQSQTKELRSRSLEQIGQRRHALDARLETASSALERLKSAIQKYDDVLNYLQVREGLQEVDAQLVVVDQTIAEARALTAQVDKAVAEGIEIIGSMAPNAVAVQSAQMAKEGIPQARANQQNGCGGDCSGGESCGTAIPNAWWCNNAACACASGGACVEGNGNELIPPGQTFEMRFSGARKAETDDPCGDTPERATCIRRRGKPWQCFSQREACGRRATYRGPSSAESVPISIEDITSQGLELSVWSAMPDPSGIDVALTEPPLPTELLAWQKSARHPGGLRKGAICVGVKFGVPAVAGGQAWLVTVYLQPT